MILDGFGGQHDHHPYVTERTQQQLKGRPHVNAGARFLQRGPERIAFSEEVHPYGRMLNGSPHGLASG